MNKFFAIVFSLLLTAINYHVVQAEIKVIEADSAYAMGDNDNKVDARRIAVQEAQRRALDMAVAYVSSLTHVKDFHLTRDEMTAYTAGVMETEIDSEEMRGAVNRPSIFVKVRCKIDTDVLMKQIEQFRDNEELKEQLLASQKENAALKQERNAILSRLAAEKGKNRIEAARKKLDTVLTKEETNTEVVKVWSVYSRKIDNRGPEKHAGAVGNGELDKAVAVLDRAVAADPKNSRVRFLLAAMHELKGDPGAAEKQLRAAIAANPANPLFHMKLGLLLDGQGRHAEALKQFLAVERLRPRDPQVIFHIGMTYKSMGQCRQSAVNLKRFLKTAERRTSPRMASMKEEAVETIKECEGKPRGPAGRQRPIRR
jgi:tetratricopeptide (TPR) repeat protein